MSLNEDLRNCRIVLRDVETGKTIADSTILTYDGEKDQIEVATDRIVLQEGSKVSALIFSAAGLYESQGTVGKKDGKKTLITLYEGNAKNDRHAVRYQVNIFGEVESVNRPSEGKIPGNFEISVLNMSSIGLLIQAPKGRIQVGDTFRFSAVSKGQRILITAQAKRVEEVESDKEKIGCSVQLVNLG